MSTATTPTSSAPPLDAELERLLKRMRLPYIRRAAPELLATAKAQRWDPGEVLKALLAEEVCGHVRWPRVGRSHGHHRAVFMTATGQFFMSLDRRGSPLTGGVASGRCLILLVRLSLLLCGRFFRGAVR